MSVISKGIRQPQPSELAWLINESRIGKAFFEQAGPAGRSFHLVLFGGMGLWRSVPGVPYAVTIIVMNSDIISALLVVFVVNRRGPVGWSNLVFHAGVFCWLAWCAFLWLGELI